MAVNGMVERLCKEEDVGYVDLWDSCVRKEQNVGLRDIWPASEWKRGLPFLAEGLSGAVRYYTNWVVKEGSKSSRR